LAGIVSDCGQMEHMDMGKMDPKDPVMKAMHDKCMAAMKDHHEGREQKPDDAQDKSEPDKSAVHPHGIHDAK
jgi:hypothetical protein